MGIIRLEGGLWEPFGDHGEVAARPTAPERPVALRVQGLVEAAWTPACHAATTSSAYSLALDLPGVAREDIHVSLDGNVVVVEGERRAPPGTARAPFFGRFHGRFVLPDDAVGASLEATHVAGVLTLTIPRRERQRTEVAVH